LKTKENKSEYIIDSNRNNNFYRISIELRENKIKFLNCIQNLIIDSEILFFFNTYFDLVLLCRQNIYNKY